ncbi:hypothetical protein JFV30_13560 [Pseudomonas sp. TH32]|uniref:hypothetical protein n=1 Tax=unclassified Pseudomonas TaxID=196821 RepID=UPI001914279F|nr:MULTISPECIES: hypothetical protein [unclassified Pseudomonas]MBK5437809.1 hypothetical protein [Pseudomonas sp. TH32]MDF3202325.1 hypothetical protein [Pseudomonas sp. 1912-s]
MNRPTPSPVIPFAKGSFTAEIRGYFAHEFDGQVFELHQEPYAWTLTARQVIEHPYQSYTFTIILPLDLPQDGSKHTYRFGASGAGAILFSQGINFQATEGEITVSLKNNRMNATFNFFATTTQNGQTYTVNVSRGVFDVHNGTGEFLVALSGASPPFAEFRAKDVTIVYEDPVVIPPYYQVIGREFIDWPPDQHFFTVYVEQGVAPGEYSLGDNDAKVRVIIGQRAGIGIYNAYSGKISLESLPETGHAKGDFKAQFRTADDREFYAEGTFDVVDR